MEKGDKNITNSQLYLADLKFLQNI